MKRGDKRRRLLAEQVCADDANSANATILNDYRYWLEELNGLTPGLGEIGGVMSFWQKHEIEAKVINILRDVPDSAKEHHMGRLFLTAYQIAIEFARRYPDIVKELGWPVGGEGTGKRNTLAQYLARWLSQLVKDNPRGQIEGGFLSNQHLDDIRFDNSGEIIHSSLTGSGYTLSMFRLRD